MQNARGWERRYFMKKTLTTVILTLLILTLAFSTALLTYLHFFASDDRGLSGEWTADLDMTKQAAVTAFSWLQDIEGVAVSPEDMEERMRGLTVQVSLTFEPSAHSEGVFHCDIDPESYEACRQTACEAFATAFRELLAERLRMAGYTGSMDEDAIEALVTETFGMSTEDYLAACGPELLPPLEDLQARYDGSGTYETTEDVLTRRFDDGGAVVTKTETYLRQDVRLILLEETDTGSPAFSSDEYPMIYTLKQSQEQ